MKFKLTIFSLLLLASLGAGAQQIPMFSQYMFNRLVVNPGYAGDDLTLNSMLIYRNQFTGFEGGPVTQSFTTHAPIPGTNMAGGLKILNDQIGVTNITSVSLVYAYKIFIGPGQLSLALEGGIVNSKIDFTTLERRDLSDPVINLGAISKMIPDASFGLYYSTNDKRFYAGFSALQLVQSKLDYSGFSRDVIARLSQHYYAIAGYKIPISEDVFDIEPSVLVKYVAGAPVQIDANARFIYREMISLGTSYRTGDGLVFMLEYNFNDRIRAGYAYDLTLSQLQSYQDGAHEIMINYKLKLPEPPRKQTVDPRIYIKDQQP